MPIRELTEKEQEEFQGKLDAFVQALLGACQERDPSVTIEVGENYGSPMVHINQGPCTSHWRIWLSLIEGEVVPNFERVYF